MGQLAYPIIVSTGTHSSGRTQWRLTERFRLRVPMGGGFYTWHVSADTVTDFASVPRALWWFLSPTDPHILVAALIHDELYRHPEMLADANVAGQSSVESKTVSRWMADAWFREIMRLYGASVLKRVAAYWAVRIFGWMAWRGGD